MASARVRNIDNSFPIKLSKVRRLVDECLCTFVDANSCDTKEETALYRNLSLAETVRARSERARDMAHIHLGYAELPETRVEGIRTDWKMVAKAHTLRTIENVRRRCVEVNAPPEFVAALKVADVQLRAECAL